MKIVPILLAALVCVALPIKVWSEEARVLPAAVELQTKLLSLELPAGNTDRGRVGATMDSFAHDHGFTTSGGPASPLWNIQRFYVGPRYTSVVVSFFPEHTFIGISKRPGDGDAHQDLVDALNAAFGPLGFKPWVEPVE